MIVWNPVDSLLYHKRVESVLLQTKNYYHPCFKKYAPRDDERWAWHQILVIFTPSFLIMILWYQFYVYLVSVLSKYNDCTTFQNGNI